MYFFILFLSFIEWFNMSVIENHGEITKTWAKTNKNPT